MRFELDDLPYSQEALEPHISGRTLEFHYGKHHRGYMKKLEKAIGDTDMADKSLEEIVLTSEGSVYNNAAQVWNHTFYWNSMAPDGGGEPQGPLADAIARDLGSLTDACATLKKRASGQFGSGWAWLVADRTGKLAIQSTSDAVNPMRQDFTPLLTIDVWEHAYYLDYQNDRAKYLDGVISSLLNWRFAERNFEGVTRPDRRAQSG